MTATTTKVNDLANAYRAAMRAGDQQLAHSRVQRLILQAIVADSASRAEIWVKTRVEDGVNVAKPLTELAPELAKGNPVGEGLQWARDQAFKQAKGAVNAAVTGVAVPAGIAAVLAFFGGLFGFSQDAGAAFGAVAIPALFAGGPIVYAVIRALSAAPQLAGAAGEAAGSALDTADSIGASAESVYQAHAVPALGALTELGYQPPSSSPVLSQLRGGAKAILITAYLILAACVVFFCFGIGDAFSAYQAQQAACSLQLPDGTCLDG